MFETDTCGQFHQHFMSCLSFSTEKLNLSAQLKCEKAAQKMLVQL
jgi:hypothetical protein